LLEPRTVGGDTSATALLGMPEDNDWILYGAYSDKSLMRNWLSYKLSNEMGRYAVRGRFCEVILDGQYIGVYQITESISRGNDRVDISRMTSNDIFSDALTGGYMCKIDWLGGPHWASNYPPDPLNPSSNVVNFQIIYPKPANIVPAQQAYFETYVDSFENALFGPNYADTTVGWRHYADEGSFVDYFILNELAKNVDAYWLSTYFYKDKDSKGGKITMGPSWDFNGAWHGADYCNAPDTFDWHYNEPSYCACDMPLWWKRLVTDTLFTNNLQCRWAELSSTILDTSHIFHLMDSAAALLNQAQVRHFIQWPILGVYTWPNPSPLAQTFAEEIAYTKTWIRGRINWINANLPGTCYPPVVGIEGPQLPKISVFPNPNQGDFQVQCAQAIESVRVTDVFGKEILRLQPERADCRLQLPHSGIYFVAVRIDGVEQVQKVTVTR
jgi:CotH kinase protein